ncbi:MAG: hypothetical protein M0Z66_06195 [Thermaerobacter sp.]|nr:hypothetical protein [Thermaerobacter sp.]
MSVESEVQQLVDLYHRLAALLGEIEQAVMLADTDRLSELVPQQEELMRRAAEMPLPSEAPPALVQQLEEAAGEAVRRNTTNAVLLSEQLALIQETMKAILGEQRAIDHLA